MTSSASPAQLYGTPGWSSDPRVSNSPGVPVGPEGVGIFPGLMAPAWLLPLDGTAQADNPFHRDTAVQAMQPGWQLMDSVVGGTEYIRTLANLYLPKEPREDLDAWGSRLRRSILSPYTTRLIENAAGAVLRRPVQIEGVRYWSVFARNVDGIGSSVNEFARRLLVSALTYGHSTVLVDYPASSADRNLLETRLSGRRPYFNHTPAQRILGWRQSNELPSSPLEQIRIHELVRVPKGKYGEELIDQARIIEPGRTRTVRRNTNPPLTSLQMYDSSELIDLMTTPGGSFVESSWEEFSLPIIPVVPMYTNRTGVLQSTPLLNDIANLNIAHYQRQADFLHALHIAAMPTLVLEGWDESSSTSVGVNYALGMHPGNQAYYIPSDSSSFEAQANALLMLEQQMSSLGVTKLLGQKFVAESADAKRIDQAQANSVLSIISMELEACLQTCFNIAAVYLNISPPKISINRDFSYYTLIGQDMSVLGDLTSRGLMSPDAYVKAMQSGEVYPDSVDIPTEINYVSEQVSKLQEQQDMAMEAQQQANESPSGDQPEGQSSDPSPAT